MAGDGLLRRAANFLPWALGRSAEARSRRALRATGLGPGQIAIDCGANVGDVTEVLARTGATVHAFEPNPFAFERLSLRMRRHPNVLCLPRAVDATAGTARLFLHEHSAQDEVHWSNGSSLLREKGNVSKDRFVEVECIDLADYIRQLGGPVAVLKMDVEGAECRILRRLIDAHLLASIGNVFVEMHDERIPGLQAESSALRRIVKENAWHHVRLDWV